MSALLVHHLQDEVVESLGEPCAAGAWFACANEFCPQPRHIVRCTRGVEHPPDMHVAVAPPDEHHALAYIAAVWLVTPTPTAHPARSTERTEP